MRQGPDARYTGHRLDPDGTSRMKQGLSTQVIAKRLLLRIILIALVLAPLLSSATVRDYYFRNLDASQGLSQGRITALMQDRQGFIWVATDTNLHRYDGYVFRSLEQLLHQGDPPSMVRALTEATDGRIYIGTARDGLFVLDRAQAQFSPFKPAAGDISDLDGRIDTLLYQDGVGLWIGTPEGIGLLDPDSGHYTRILALDPIIAATGLSQHTYVLSMVLDSSGVLWAGTFANLERIDTRDRSLLPAIELRANTLDISDTGDLWVGTDSGLYLKRAQADSVERVWPRTPEYHDSNICCGIRALVAADDGSIWLAVHEGGLWRYDPDFGRARLLASNPWIEGMLPERDVTRMLIDRSNLLWLGGTSRGLSTTSLAGAPFRTVFDLDPSHDTLSGNFILALSEDVDGRLWLGTRAGLRSHDPTETRFRRHDLQTQLPSHGTDLSIRAIAHDNEDGLWLATQWGLYRFDIHTDQTRAIPLESEDDTPVRLNTLARRHDGSLWLARDGYGLLHYRPGNGQVHAIRPQPGEDNALQLAHIEVIEEDSRGRIWLGGRDGLDLYEPDRARFRHFKHEPDQADSLSGTLIQAIHEGRDGSLWIGSNQGLDQLVESAEGQIHFRAWPMEQTVRDPSVLAIVEDREGNLWLSGNAGLARLDRNSGQYAHFDLDDGLQSLRFNPGAALLLHNGNLAFGGVRGLNLANPAQTFPSRYMPVIMPSWYAIGRDDAVNILGTLPEIRLPAQQHMLQIGFTALDYTAPQNTLFSHQLEGHDTDFSLPDPRPWMVWSDLAPGHYQLRVRATNHSGVWTDTELHIPIEVLSPWWLTRPAKAVYLVLALLALAALWQWQRLRIRRRQELLTQIREREERLKFSLWGAGYSYWDWDLRQNRLLRIGSEQMLHTGQDEEVSVQDWREKTIHPEDLPRVQHRLQEHLAGRSQIYESEHRIRNGLGEWIWVRARGKVVERDAQNNPLRMAGTARDIGASRHAARERRIASEVLRSMSEAVAVLDLDFRFVSVNPAFLKTTGYREQDVLGMPDSLLQSSRHPQEFFRQMHETLLGDGQYRGEVWLHRYDGEEFLGWVEISQVSDEAGVRSHYVAVLNDITDKKRAEQELRYLANYDTLTGLPNRSLLSERLARAVVKARRNQHRLALLFLDLDHFKVLNDSLGHATGDRILKATATRLLGVVGTTDTVARLGGDEFTILMEDVTDVASAAAMAQAVIAAFQTAVLRESDNDVVISPSIGIALYPDHAQVPVDLLKHADAAMYRAKDRGRNTFQFYDQTMDQEIRLRASMTAALRRALDRGELHLEFQPRQCLADGRIVGVEALLRWTSEEFGNVPPTTFIPLAEETGLILSLGEWVLREACRSLSHWRSQGATTQSMAVNVSMLQLLRGDLPAAVTRVLAETGIDASSLELEITESVAMANAA